LPFCRVRIFSYAERSWGHDDKHYVEE
jgi:hypothetical protein